MNRRLRIWKLWSARFGMLWWNWSCLKRRSKIIFTVVLRSIGVFRFSGCDNILQRPSGYFFSWCTKKIFIWKTEVSRVAECTKISFMAERISGNRSYFTPQAYKYTVWICQPWLWTVDSRIRCLHTCWWLSQRKNLLCLHNRSTGFFS